MGKLTGSLKAKCRLCKKPAIAYAYGKPLCYIHFFEEKKDGLKDNAFRRKLQAIVKREAKW